MEDTPQGGSGGVPLHHDEDPPAGREQPDEPTPVETVKTVRAGTSVADQKAALAGDGDEDDAAGETGN
ncbi:hypothetical protein ACIRS1_35320 [Kitasatospora sp. NPDC101176]|uniref:hypothetical protein n=1 Tax=Kitasatospora sp. NPDC101176 TaxID=3364099 RepID=UPI0038111313